MKKLFTILAGFSALGIFSCEETIVLDLSSQATPQVVIEGLITNKNKHHTVKITRSRGFYDSGKPGAITDASVTVEAEGQSYTFLNNPANHPDSAAYYFSTLAFAGQEGTTYYLNVMIDGQTYQSSDELFALAPIDSLSYAIDEDEAADPEDEGFIYEVYFYMKEPQATKDYYLFKFYRDGEEVYDSYESVYVSNDDLLKENIDGVSAAAFYELGDTVTVRSYSLSEPAYRFYTDVSSAMNNDGGIFGPPPANPRTNITGGALGVFQASWVREKNIVIK
jgi:hypothetical protein